MANKTVIASGKGGVGKTTLCAGLGKAFSDMDKKTLIIDCDAGLAGLDILFGCTENVNFTWIDAVLGRCEIRDSVIEISENLHLIPSPRTALQEEFEDALCTVINSLDDSYDIILCDAPAGLGRGVMRAIKACDNCIVVATADEISVKGAYSLQKTAEENGIKQSRLVINRYDLKAAYKGRLLTVDEIIDKTIVQLIGIVPEDKNIMYRSVSQKKLKTKKSDAAFTRIAKRIIGEKAELVLSQLK